MEQRARRGRGPLFLGNGEIRGHLLEIVFSSQAPPSMRYYYKKSILTNQSMIGIDIYKNIHVHVKSTCDVNLLSKLSIIFNTLYFRYYTQTFFVSRLIINQINKVQSYNQYLLKIDRYVCSQCNVYFHRYICNA
jgi:hypothetical protein